MFKSRPALGLLGLFFFLAATVSSAEDKAASWPQFHGPNRDNLSTETGLLEKWPDQGPALLWSAGELGQGYSSVSIAHGLIFTAGDIKDDTVITALDLDGRKVWQAKNGESWLGSYPGSRGTPTIDGKFLYHESPHGDVSCFEVKTGKKVWTVNILEKYESKNIMWALSESLLIDGDQVICCPGGAETAVVALDKKTGKEVWKSESTKELAGYTSPLLVEYGGLRMILTMTSRALIGVEAESGRLLFHEKHVTYADENVITPIFRDGFLFVSTVVAGSVKWKLTVEEGEVSLEKVWTSKEMDNHHGGVVLVGDNLYGASCVYNKEAWICLDWKTGEKKYVDNGVGKGSLTYADGKLYILSRASMVGLVEPTPEKHALVSSFKIPAKGKGPSWAHPVVCGGRLYIRHGNFLHAYDIKAGEPR